MTVKEKEQMGTLLLQYAADVNLWIDAEENPEKKAHFLELKESINKVLDSFKENLETDEW